jgi:hypothetical protein
MDQYTTHIAPEIEKEAEELEIKIIWVPKGGTGRCQPLDRRTFGARKSKGNAKWRRYFSDYHGFGCTQDIGAELLLESWQRLFHNSIQIPNYTEACPVETSQLAPRYGLIILQ